MKIFYGKSANRPDVPCETPADVSLETALEIFRGLTLKSGFMGVNLDDRYVLQILARKRGIEVELLDTSIPAFDSCTADSEFAESLIRAAAAGQNVFQIARAGDHDWRHLNLANPAHSDSARSSPTGSNDRSGTSENTRTNKIAGPIEFTATECGFDDGLGGASNSAAGKDYHYVLFGRQTDVQHPEYSGVYFEFDSQINGAANCVVRVTVRDGAVDFGLKEGRTITVLRGTMAAPWDIFLSGIRDTFDREIIQKT